MKLRATLAVALGVIGCTIGSQPGKGGQIGTTMLEGGGLCPPPFRLSLLTAGSD
jgi:hypothetical protein